MAKHKKRVAKVKESAAYYDRHGILDDLIDEPVDLGLSSQLERDILEGHRRRQLQNTSIRIDPAHLQAIRKIATMRAIPYQTLIRHWLAEHIRKELRIGASEERSG